MTARPVYRKTSHRPSKFIQRHKSAESDKTEETNGSLDGSHNSKLSRGRSKTLKNAIGQLKPMQVRNTTIFLNSLTDARYRYLNVVL